MIRKAPRHEYKVDKIDKGWLKQEHGFKHIVKSHSVVKDEEIGANDPNIIDYTFDSMIPFYESENISRLDSLIK